MKNNLFDKHIKEQLGAARPDVPAHVWENIIAKKDKRKPVGYFTNNFYKMIAAALFLLTGVGGTIYLLSHKNFTSNKNFTTAKINSTNNSTPSNKNNTGGIKDAERSLNKSSITNNNNLTESNQNLDGHNSLYNSKSATNITINAPNLFDVNEELNITTIDEHFLKAVFVLNDLKQKKYSFNPTLKLYQLPKSPIIPCPEAEKNTAGNKKYIEVYGGPDYFFRNLSDTANSVYLQQRKNSVKYLFAYSAGIRYTKVFGSGMSFRTGVNYSQINEQFKSEKGRITQNVYIINTNGDTTGSYVQSGTQYKTSTNKYRSIDIPVSVGYELGNGRLHANINAGAMINISSSQKGFMLDYAGNAVDISSGKSSSVYQYKTKAGVSFIGATSIYYKLNEKIHLMAEPYVKLSLSPMTKPEISLKEKFHTAGVRLGVRMDF